MSWLNEKDRVVAIAAPKSDALIAGRIARPDA